MKFKIDENLPNEITEVLNAAGHNAVSVQAQNLSGAEDAAIASRIAQEERCLITLDLGFADIRAYPPGLYSGLVVLRSKKQDKHTVLSLLHGLVPLLASETLAGRLWIVEEDRVRIRGESG